MLYISAFFFLVKTNKDICIYLILSSESWCGWAAGEGLHRTPSPVRVIRNFPFDLTAGFRCSSAHECTPGSAGWWLRRCFSSPPVLLPALGGITLHLAAMCLPWLRFPGFADPR